MEQEDFMSLGKFVAKRRAFLHMTQEQLAEELHVSKSAIAKWETDRGIPDRDNMKELAEIFRMPVGELYQLIDGYRQYYDADINITSDVIAMLEFYGYTVIPPAKKDKED